MIVDIIPPIQNGRVKVYTAEIAYQPATAYCIGSVHEVGWRAAGRAWYGTGANGWLATGTHAVPFHRNRPS